MATNTQPTRPPVKKRKVYFVDLIEVLCSELGIGFEALSDGWILRLSKADQIRHIYGYDFGLNASTNAKICKDKAATTIVLQAEQVPVVEHKLFHTGASPRALGGHWQRMRDYLDACGGVLVAKPNRGTGGRGVIKVHDYTDLEYACQKIAALEPGIALSPFYEAQFEYRTVILDGRALVCYRKRRPRITGDGTATVLELLGNDPESMSTEVLRSMAESGIDLHRVLAKGQHLELSWRHNLKAGASPDVLEEGPLKAKVEALSLRAGHALGIRFATVDVLQTHDALLVMEVNSVVTMVRFAMHSPHEYEMAKGLYRQSLQALFR